MITIKEKIILNYWKNKLNGYETINKRFCNIFSSKSIIIDNDMLSYFLKVTSGNEIAEFTILLSIFGGISQRYFEDFGLIFSKEISKEKASSLLYSFESIKGKTLKQYIQIVKAEVQEVYKHSDYRNLSNESFDFEHYSSFAFSYNNDLESNAFPFQLKINKLENSDYKISISFCNSFTEEVIVVQFLENFKNWITNLEIYVSQFIESISILTIEEKELVLNVFNGTEIPFDATQTIISLFEKQVATIQDNIAIVFDDKKVSYRLLDAKSNQFAHYLQINHQLSPEDLIAVKLERSEWLVISLLAVLKLGGTYVPIDMNYPEDRITYIENDSNSKLLIDASLLEQFNEVQDNFSKEKIDVTYDPDRLAYIIYTSGTTGNPKGVMLTHRNAVSLIQWSQKEFDASTFDIVYAATSHCFDLSVFEMFYTLSIGKTIRILRSGLDIPSYLALDENVLINTVPSTIRKIMEDGHDLNNISILNLAGESFPLDIANKLTKTGIEVRNLYGPSEDTTYSTYYKLTKNEYTASVPIGKPISNTQAYILDDNLELLPIGVVGKLYLSGTGLTRGYLNRPDLTSEKFISNPFEKGTKMYDTGDLAKWDTNGTMEFFGRKDDQIKLRGYRIELGEIENKILQFSIGVQNVVVIVKEIQKEQVLVAYYVESSIINKSDLRSFLSEQLPSYMIPNHFVRLSSIPLTPNGKVNKKALPGIISSDVVRNNYVAPNNKTEEKLVSIWEEVIGIEGIGITDHFFELGGHSLMISQMFNMVHREMNKSIPFKKFYSNPTIKDVSTLLQNDAFVTIKKVPILESYTTTPSQHRLWLLSQIEESNQAYLISGALSLKGNIVIENFTKAFNYVIDRHEILRTYFKNNEEGVLQQLIIPESDFNYGLSVEDFSVLETPYIAVEKYIEECQATSFDLSKGPLFKAALLKVGDDGFIFFLSMHHIISDGWSLEVLTSEVMESYKQLQTGEAFSLPHLPIQFKDYAVWLKEASKKREQKQAKEYWLDNFQGELPVLELPTYRNRPLIKTYSGQTLSYRYSSDVLLKLQDFSKSNQVTLFMTLMTAVKSLLSRYSNQKDIIIGTAIAGREHSELESQIGLYLNTLAIRTQWEEQDSFLDVLNKEKQQLLDAYTYQEYPFDQLVSQLNLKRDASRSPLFDIMVVLQNQNQLSSFRNRNELTDVAIDEYKINRKTSQFDLSLTFIEKENGLLLEVSYNTDIYSESFITSFFSHLEMIFAQILEFPGIEIGAIDLLTKEEKQTVLENSNNTKVDFDLNQTIIDTLKNQVSKTPNGIAIVFEDKRISYRTLEERSNQLAHYLLQNCKVLPEDLIAVKLERSEWLIISLLAILQSGGAYVPIDNEYPETRIQYIIEDTGTKIVIDERFLNKFFSEDELPTHSPELKLSPTQLAYVIYTSGSTGKPKGVMIEHKSLLNLCLWHKEAYDVKESSRGTLFSGVAFDASVWEIYPYLLSGATLYPINDNEIRLNTNKLVSFLKEKKITHAYLPSKICQSFIEQNITDLNTVILTGGEELRYPKKTTLQVFNNYGPTENTVVTTYYNCKNVFKENVPIGKPIDNTEVYILSENLKIQPIGIQGELCVSGVGLSRGYLGQPELTQEKFITHPFKEGERLYKTGDIARWLPDGNLEFIGRKDQQIKIRGNRIELGEIEYALLEYSEGINQAVVVLDKINLENVLVVYYVVSESIDKSKLRAYLISKLPDYMIPGYFLEIEAIPLTANGKINRRELPKITESDVIKKEYVAPTNEIEEKVVNIWKDLLEIEKIGITDDFFELGGHSLLLNRLTNEYHRIFKKELNLKEIYSNTTPKNHAKLLSTSVFVDEYEIEKVVVQDQYDVSPSQLRFWLLYKINGKSKEFNIYSKLSLPKNLEINNFESAFNDLLKRHEVLRTVFVEESGVPKQQIIPYAKEVIPIVNTVNEAKQSVFDHAFELDTFPLYRLALIKNKDNYTLYFNIHHSISDGWSMNVISRDLMELYTSKINNNLPILPILSIQYKDYAHWQNKILGYSEINNLQNYWKEQLTGELPYLQLPSDYDVKSKSTENSSSYTFYVPEKLKLQIQLMARKNSSSVFAVFIAVLKIFLYRLTSEKDIIIGIPAANRNHFQIKDVVGCFINTLMLRDTINENLLFIDWFQQIDHTLRDALAHQNYPFEKLLEQLNVPKKDNRFPISQVFLNMVDFEIEDIGCINNFTPYHQNVEATPKFALEYYVKTYENGIALNCVYDHNIFNRDTIEYWSGAFLSILEQSVDTPFSPLDSIKVFENPLCTKQDKTPSNSFEHFDNVKQQTIVSRFEKQVKINPEAEAVYSNGKSLTYKQLNNCTNHLASKIYESIGDNKRIALLLSHDETCVLGMLGSLKAGCSYVPIDVNNPLSRVEYIIKDAGCALIICSENTQEFANLLLQKDIAINILTISNNYNLPAITINTSHTDSNREAYVLYTSGSTGLPKGVLQNQRNVLHYISVYTNSTHISSNDNLSVFSTYTFDASVKDIYGAILNGATVSLYNIVEKGIDSLAQWLKSQKITVIHMVPTVYRNFLKMLNPEQKLTTIRLVDLGGESCHKQDFELFIEHFDKDAFFVNDYGPTEATIVTQKFFSHTSEVIKNNLSIGKAVDGTEVFLLKENNQKAGIYERGEIVFKSPYLSLGYLNRPELTEKVFTTDPTTGSGNIYRSGDIGKILPNGEIEFLHRKDSQVKLNGLRIELKEIVYQLEQLQMIREALVFVKELEGNQYITAYLLKNEEIENITIKKTLELVLPKYMIPVIYITLSSFPYTRTGKIDSKALPDPTIADLKTTPYIEATNEIEEGLVVIWADILKLSSKTIGIMDNFFELGGNSLQAVVIINKINKTYNTVLSIANLYETLTVQDLAILINFSLSQNQEHTEMSQEQDEVIL